MTPDDQLFSRTGIYEMCFKDVDLESSVRARIIIMHNPLPLSCKVKIFKQPKSTWSAMLDRGIEFEAKL